MNTLMNTTTESHLYRSEAFAEDVLDLVSAAPVIEPPVDLPIRWLVNAVPVAVALLGVAFAVVPPLG
jgi:hypothetical protein